MKRRHSNDEERQRVGQRIKAIRQARGLSQSVVAGLAGIDQTTLSRIERGEGPSDNRFVLADIAAALRVPLEEITGVPGTIGGKLGHDAAAAAYATSTALADVDLRFAPPDLRHRPMPELAQHVLDLRNARIACDYLTVCIEMPRLLRELHAAAYSQDHRLDALAAMVAAAESCAFAVRYTGTPSDAYVAGDRARQAAELADDPLLLAMAGWTEAHAALAQGLHRRAAAIASQSADALAPHTNRRGAPEMLGMLYLTTAFSLVGNRRRDDAEAPLAEARTLAQHTGETDTHGFFFGPTNVSLWEIAMCADGGDPADAVALAEHVNPQVIPSPSRQSAFYADLGRALARLGHADQAVRALLAAERIAPQRVHGDPMVAEAVAGLLDLVRRRAVGSQLRGLAERLDVVAPAA